MELHGLITQPEKQKEDGRQMYYIGSPKNIGRFITWSVFIWASEM